MSGYCVVLITAGSTKEAGLISRNLVQKKLAACVNIVPKVTSIFFWKGKSEKATETLLIVKTKRSALKKLIAKVQQLHSYDVPEIIALPIIQGNREYLKWVGDSTS